MHARASKDEKYAFYKAEALRCLSDYKLKWRHHGIGVLQAYVLENEPVEHRLHIWSKSLIKDGITGAGDAHDHRFDMVSHVLFGTIMHEEWFLTESKAGTWTTMDLIHAREAGLENNFHGPMTPTGIRYKRNISNLQVSAGQLYTFPKGQFHRTLIDGFTITWVEKHAQDDHLHARIAHPIDILATPAFGHEMDPEQVKFLVNLAIEVLRG